MDRLAIPVRFVLSPLSTAATALALLMMGAGDGFAQRVQGPDLARTRGLIGKHQVALDVGVLEGGLSYARRIGAGRYALGGRLWAAWEPWNSFKANVFEPMGGELLVRYHPSEEVQLEFGPSLLRYLWADDCSECRGTFVGAHAAAMVGKGIFSLGPAVRFGVLSGAPSGSEAGFLFGFQGRLRFSGGD